MTGQDILSIIIVVAAIAYLVLRFTRSKDNACGGDCSCDDKIAHKSPQKQ